MNITKEQARQWLKEVKQNKRNTLDKMTKELVEEYEKEFGSKPSYIETL